ncbi:LapA family protein [Nocardia terpenica]|uniref:Lipopolysaccharide assembly protein A domain-containing protein n=1 Tax=Nocardia terpenica TaxID=455432 RepID=A0A291RS59_9NOCA|nr:LapA family protein [Nocardia terpenica]ATL70165.1 hypothetical protein CRH09_32260 [Nocardia terpenica]
MTNPTGARPTHSSPSPTEFAATSAEAGPPSVRNPLRSSRTGTAWIGIVVFAVVLVLLLIFILQNTQSVKISYIGMSGHLSLAVAMLLAAIAGVLLTATAGSMRIWQIRRRVRRSSRR